MNERPRRTAPALALTLPLLLAGGSAAAADARTEHGVYEYVVERAATGVPETAEAVEQALLRGGFRILGRVDAGSPAGCRFQSRVVAASDPAYAARLMAANRRTGPFAVVDRINVFADEAGTHVAVVNAESVNRTVLMDDPASSELARAHVVALRSLLSGVVPGTASEREYGEKRSRGYIGKTMGVMAGGPFGEKIDDEAVIGGADWKGVAARLREGLARPGGRWGLHLVYELELPEHETVVLGSSGTPMDSKSFSIVRAGADDARGSYRCPGLAHAAAYPIEIVVTREGDSVRVRMVDAMYRMKMYFEDAGKWAFMKNMGMPGSIHDELAGQIRAALGQR